MLKIESQLNYNNKKYGQGKAYISKIIEKDVKYKFKREFLKRYTNSNDTSQTTWFDYYWEIVEDGIYEYYESNGFKSFKKYWKVENDLILELKEEEIENLI